MSSESPLVTSVRQAFQSEESTLHRTFRNVPVNVNDPNVYSALRSVDPPLPGLGDFIEGTVYRVTAINVRPVGSRTDVADVTVSYTTIPVEGSPSNVSKQPGTEVTFEIFPESTQIEIDAAVASPLITKTIELDEQGTPIGEVGSAVPEISRTTRSIVLDRVRVNYTITGTATALGLPIDFSFGSVPVALAQQRFLHVIGGVPLLFRSGVIRQVRRSASTPEEAADPSLHTYAISYEWVFDSGIGWGSPPEQWTVDPGLGPADDLVVVANTRGSVSETEDFDIFSGVFIPNIRAPLEIEQILSSQQRYIRPPYCDVNLVLKADHSFPYPSFVPAPEYTRADSVARLAWQSLPGVF